MKLLKTYLYSYQANLDIAKLKDEGINSYIKDENIVSIDPILAQAVGGIKLMVYEEDYDKAIEVINKNDFDNLKNEFPEEDMDDQRRCKKCGSTNILQRNSWLIGVFFFLISFAPVAKKKSRFECLDCSYKWSE